MSVKLGICAIPVFFKLPGVSSNDLGIRTQGNLASSTVISFLRHTGFVTNRRLLLSGSGKWLTFGKKVKTHVSRRDGSGFVLLEGSTGPCRLYRSCFGAHGYHVRHSDGKLQEVIDCERLARGERQV